MPKSRKYQWVYAPSKQNKPKVPETEKQIITQKIQILIKNDLATHYITQEEHTGIHIESFFTK